MVIKWVVSGLFGCCSLSLLPQRSGQSRRLTGRLYYVPGVPSCHALLLVKLPAIGVSDSLLGWPKDFLLGRRMKALRVVILMV